MTIDVSSLVYWSMRAENKETLAANCTGMRDSYVSHQYCAPVITSCRACSMMLAESNTVCGVIYFKETFI